MNRDRRDSYRLGVAEGEAVVDVPAGTPEPAVVDLSGGGSCLVFPREVDLPRERFSLVIHPRHGDPVRALMVPVHSHGHEGQRRFGFRFDDLEPRDLATLSQHLLSCFMRQSRDARRFERPRGTVIGQPRRGDVDRILRVLAMRRRVRLAVHHSGHRLPLGLVIRSVEVDRARRVLVCDVTEGSGEILAAGEEYGFAFPGPNAVNRFDTAVWWARPREVALLVPAAIRQVGFRSALRYAIEVGDSPSLFIPHPRLRGVVLEKTILDVSASGLSFEVLPQTDALFPGESIGPMVLADPSGAVRLWGRIRSVKPVCGGKLSCGVEISGFEPGGGERLWHEFVFHRGHGHLTMGRGEHVESAWDVLETSGYVDLLDESRRGRLRDRFVEAWSRYADRPAASRFFLFEGRSRPVGTAAASLLYPGTWMPHHFGIDREERARGRDRVFSIARQVYSGTMYLVRHAVGARHFVFYFDADKRWHDLLFGRFLRGYPGRDEFIWDRFVLFRATTGVAPSGTRDGRDGEVRVVANRPDLVEDVARCVESSRTPLEVEAMSLGRDGILLEDFEATCRSAGYERTRTLLFALAGDSAAACLALETGDESTNVFGLLNRCWFLDMPGADGIPAAPMRQARRLLLEEARRRYGSAGKEGFLFMGDPGASREMRDAAPWLERVADGVRWLASCSIIPAYLNHLEEVMEEMGARSEDGDEAV